MLDLTEIKEKLSDRKLYIVADRCGVSPKTLYNVLNGKSPNYKTIEKISDYLESKDD